MQAALAVVRPPGHHAECARAQGFCFFNNCAVAARVALAHEGVERVLVLDWDVHHGNGIQEVWRTCTCTLGGCGCVHVHSCLTLNGNGIQEVWRTCTCTLGGCGCVHVHSCLTLNAPALHCRACECHGARTPCTCLNPGPPSCCARAAWIVWVRACHFDLGLQRCWASSLAVL